MSKRTQTAAIGAGEELLRQWSVANDVVSLRAAWGRDPAADAAIVERLAHIESAASADALAELEGGTADKALRKDIRRALFRLEQKGLAAARPEPGPAPAVATITADGLEGYMSASDGNGDQLLWLIKPRRGELLQLFAVINDPNGMRETELHPTTRKVMRAAREDLLAKHEIRIVEVDWRYCDARMHHAYRWAGEKGAAVQGDYLRLRSQLLAEPPIEIPHPILAALDARQIRADAAALAESAALCEEKELRTWFFPPDALKVYLEELEQAQNSPLLLNPHQQRERAEQIIERAVAEIFGGESQPSYCRRLLDLAWVFHVTRRPDPAKRALAVALALEVSERGGTGIPFCEALVRLSIGAFLRAAAEKQQERARESLIMTPQEAARAAEQRRGPR
jgi:hypothetical protein